MSIKAEKTENRGGKEKPAHTQGAPLFFCDSGASLDLLTHEEFCKAHGEEQLRTTLRIKFTGIIVHL